MLAGGVTDRLKCLHKALCMLQCRPRTKGKHDHLQSANDLSMKVGMGLDALQGTTCMLCRNLFMHDDAPYTSPAALHDSQAEAVVWS